MAGLSRDDWLVQHELTPPELEEFAKEIKAHFKRLKREVYPNWNHSERMYMSPEFWNELAVTAIDLGVTPHDVVDMAYKAYGANMQPHHLCKKGTTATAKQRHDEKVEALSSHVKWCAARMYAIRKRTNREIADIITDEFETFSPTFRWCIATHMNMPEVAARYAKDAIRKLSDPVHRAVYTKAFPKLIEARKEARDAE
jgi:hypothetical protein